MSDLAAFRHAVREARRFAGRTQQQLARTMGLHPDVLSHKLNGRDGSVLTMRDVLSLVATLVEWSALPSRAEVDGLLEHAGVPVAAAAGQDWYIRLEPGRPARTPDSTSPDVPSGSSAAGAPEGAVGHLNGTALPSPLTRFIGRSVELDRLADVVRANRLVTVTGPGGVGKTRLAIAVAEVLQSEFADGAAFADLTPLTDPELIAAALLRALGGEPRAGVAAEGQLVEVLARARLLVVVDNLEQVVEGCEVLSRLLARAPGVHVLATSRLVLRLYGECRFHLRPLSGDDAVQLFVQRARAAGSDLAPQGETLEAVTTICTVLDGLPLALELAAAQAHTWSVQTIRDRLGERVGSLVDGVRDRPERHRSLRATLEWSDALLTPAERQVLARSAVFVGPFDAAAAAAVAGRDVEPTEVLLSRLTGHSLIEAAAGAGAAPARFKMLESVRDYARGLLEARGELAAARRAHLDHYVELATRADPRGLGEDLDRIQAESGNVNAALRWVSGDPNPEPVALEAALRLATSSGA